ncbi:hypothetical protein ACIQ4Z_23160 [Peribacillus asahii]|uniref:hypothetical protein n=1 Tax=Peribacillus asahii TaxID=228899 RepID=UPI00381F6C67
MGKMNVLLYEVHEYFENDSNFIKAQIEESIGTVVLTGEIRGKGTGIKIYVKDLNKEKYHHTLIPSLRNKGYDVEFLYTEHELFLF